LDVLICIDAIVRIRAVTILVEGNLKLLKEGKIARQRIATLKISSE